MRGLLRQLPFRGPKTEPLAQFATFSSHWIPAWGSYSVHSVFLPFLSRVHDAAAPQHVSPQCAARLQLRRGSVGATQPVLFVEDGLCVRPRKLWWSCAVGRLRSRPNGSAGPAASRCRDPGTHVDSGDVLFIMVVARQHSWRGRVRESAVRGTAVTPSALRRPAVKAGCVARVHCLATLDLGT